MAKGTASATSTSTSSSSWDKLVKLITTFDQLLSNVRTDVHVVKGDDEWIPPLPGSPPEEQIEYLRKIAQHVKDTLESAQKLSEEGRKKAYSAARDVVEEAIRIGGVIKDKVVAAAESHDPLDLKGKYKSASDLLSELWDDLKAGGKWAVEKEAEAMGVVWIGGAIFVYFFFVKPWLERGQR